MKAMLPDATKTPISKYLTIVTGLSYGASELLGCHLVKFKGDLPLPMRNHT